MNKKKKHIFHIIENILKSKSDAAEKASLRFKKRPLTQAGKHKRLFFAGVTLALVVITLCSTIISTCSVGCKITVDGQVIGTVQSEAEYNELLEKINKEIAYVSPGEFEPESEPEFTKQLIPKNDYTTEEELAERIKSTSDEMVSAYSVAVNDEIIFALPSEESAVQVMESYKNSFLQSDAEGIADFGQPVSIQKEFVPKAAIKDEEAALSALNKGRLEIYQPAPEESIEAVCAQFNVSEETLLESNPEQSADAQAADELKIPTGIPLVTVITRQTVTTEESIPYKTIEKENDTLLKGTEIVSQQGSNGLIKIESYVTSLNGVETERTILSENLLCEAVDQVVEKGTKELPEEASHGAAIPASGTLTSQFGPRWGRNHNGIDLGAPIGTAIRAAEGGTVTYAQFNNGGYGNLVIIKHANGLESYYAHCSELLVSAGESVSKGDIIAKIGNTGRSTGPHLHFEVRQNGSAINPMPYVSDLR